MKQILTVLLVGLFTTAQAKNYYVSNAGSDAANGLTPGTAWKTIAKVNAMFPTFLAGDSLLFNRGESFYGSLIVGKSGTAALPIVISAYGTGANPMITGLNTLTGWAATTAGVYKAPAPLSGKTLLMVTMNGQPQRMGRWPNITDPNGGYRTYTASTTNSITDATLPATNWTGAEVAIRKNAWVIDRCIITSQSSGVINYRIGRGINAQMNTPQMSPAKNGYGYFVQNDIRTLDQFGEWWCDTTAKYVHMYFGAATPSSYVIKYSGVDTLINANNKQYINIQNLDFEGTNKSGIFGYAGNNVNVRNCNMNNIGARGVHFQNVSNTLVENVNVNNCLSNAIQVNDRTTGGVTIRNCRVTNNGMLIGMGSWFDYSDHKGITLNTNTGGIIEYNVVDGCAMSAIDATGNNWTVRLNVVRNFCKYLMDQAGIYTFTSGTDANPGTVYVNRFILNNVVMNSAGAEAIFGTVYKVPALAGIYLDGRTMNVVVKDNTVFNMAKNGIHCNNPSNVTITGNTFYNNKNTISFFDWDWGSITNFRVTKNIIVNKADTQLNMRYTNSALNVPTPTTIYAAIGGLTSYDSNYYYTPNKLGYGFEIYSTVGVVQRFSPVSTNGMKSYFNKEVNAVQIPNFPSYSLTSTLTNTITNGDFNTNVTGISTSGASTTVLWDNSNKIAGGSLVMSFSAPKFESYSTISAPVGATSLSKNYILRFSTYGTGANGIVRASIRKSTTPFTTLATKQTSTFGIGRTDHEFLIAAPVTQAAASYLIEIEQMSGTVYIDKISFQEATVTVLDPNDKVKFFYSDTTISKTTALTGTWADSYGALYSGTVTVAPFSSKVLYYVSGAVVAPLTATVTTVNPICNGLSTGSANVTTAGGLAPVVVTWSSGETGNSISGKPAGFYTATITDAGGMIVTKFVTITQPPVLNIAVTSGTIATFGGSTSVTVTGSGGVPPYTGTGVITGVVAGTYTYPITDAAGCTKSATITITQPPATPTLTAVTTSTNVTCFSSANGTASVAASGGVPPRTYLWSTGATTQSVSGLAPGTYTVTVLDAASGSVTKTVTITQPAAALDLTVISGSITIYGGSTTVILSASGGSGGYSFTGPTTVTAGTYNYTVVDANGCSASKTITVTQPTALVASSSASVIACFGDLAVITVSGSGAVPPYTGTGTFTVPVGTYTYTIRDANGATATTTISVTQPPLLVLTVVPGVIPVTGGTTTVTVSASGGVAPYTFTGPVVGVTANTYVYTVTDARGCSKSVTITITQPASLLSTTAAVTNIDCFGNSTGSILLTTTGGIPPYTYSWPGGLASRNSLIAGTYSTTITDSVGSAIVVTKTITQPDLLVLTVTPGTISSYGGSTSVVLTAADGTAPYVFTGPTTAVKAGTYNYSVTDTKGCIKTTTITITQPAAIPTKIRGHKFHNI